VTALVINTLTTPILGPASIATSPEERQPAIVLNCRAWVAGRTLTEIVGLPTDSEPPQPGDIDLGVLDKLRLAPLIELRGRIARDTQGGAAVGRCEAARVFEHA
jgi:hypothetical protein